MVFCVTVRHATLIAHTLREMGQDAVLVTGESIDRDESIERFKRGLARFLVNIDVLTTGFDYPGVDCIAILRATKSAGLYCQIVGRGLRIADGKSDCLLLDFGGNIRRHGVLDDVAPDSGGGGFKTVAMSKECPSCGAEVSRMAKSCKHCGHVFVSNTEREVRHYAQADDADPLRKQATVYNVARVLYCRHRKEGKPDSLKVTYCTEGMQYVNEWVCVEHDGYPQQKARQWFARRGIMMPETVTEALDTSASLLCPKRITTMRDGKFERVVAYEF
jgi:DNA repair protein RadD